MSFVPNQPGPAAGISSVFGSDAAHRASQKSIRRQVLAPREISPQASL
jgi:hypothetical protein